jgi:stage II sporulation protein M
MKGKKKVSEGKKRGFWKEQYSLSWNYIKETKRYIWFTLLVLVLGIIVSLFYQPAYLVDWIRKFVETILGNTENLNAGQMIIYILNNNLQSSFYSLIIGVFFGIFPFFSAFANGYVLGFVSEKAVIAAGPLTILKLFPHGIFEFPAIILSMAMGMKFGLYQFSVNDKKKAFFSFIASLGLFLFLFAILSSLIISLISFVRHDASFSLGSSFNSSFQIVLLFSALIAYISSNYVGNLLFNPEDRKTVNKEFLRRLENSLRVFLFVVIPLLVIAAIIEGSLIVLLR